MSYEEAKKRILERIASTEEWPTWNQGTDRMALIQEAFNKSWWPVKGVKDHENS